MRVLVVMAGVEGDGLEGMAEEVEEVMSDVQMRNARFGQASQELCRAGAEEHVAKANHSAQLGRDLSAFQDKRAGKARVPRKTMGVFCLPWMDCVDTLVRHVYYLHIHSMY